MKKVTNKTYDLLQVAEAALVTSGTATLEAALFEVPEVVCYKANTVSYYIARSLAKIDFISLVNLIMNREVVKELIQDDFNEKKVTEELKQLLFDQKKRQQLKNEYTDLKTKLGGRGASEKTATLLLKTLRSA